MALAHAIGLGKSGIAAAKLLHREGWQVTVSDRQISDSLREQQQMLESLGIECHLGTSFTLSESDRPERIVISPGVPWDLPVLVEARSQGIEVLGEMELAWRSLQQVPWVAITGTNGKTTTTALIAAMFQAAGLNAPACGNIGYAACEVALQETAPDWVIAEVSSYQSESSSTLAPQIGVWTTFTPDHLSRHKTLENYYQIKAQLLRRSQQQICNNDDPYLSQARADWPDAYWTSVKGKEYLPGTPAKGIYIQDRWAIDRGEPIVPAGHLKMVGTHNLQNLLMALGAARLAGIEAGAIAKAVESFPGVPHRLEVIREIEGIKFVNDSKATNYDAAEVGLSAVTAPVILIAGGEAKDGDDRQWLAKIKSKAAAVLLIGNAASLFAERLNAVGYENTEIVETLERALPRSLELARHHSANVVLLSPACASFDQYANFEVRGDDFRQLCLSL
ncbi:UDP-N-acetylmuramoyl-L-alanine--D-glutamate ligase [Roseofilum casamattae]|uniref:UDP-N-acetylmuramoylalanine--D-glutamate ligase n=1 Tax=Roseofilum casamattae BLCC-M143 TaxID=3022442 RepID=A0ABT7BTA5_9CYAN|nr:UDP-N-acetylmuramoyl-L-alanine--D-glutamate ligase [Roseofilum casamattae BLCC-M143]